MKKRVVSVDDGAPSIFGEACENEGQVEGAIHIREEQGLINDDEGLAIVTTPLSLLPG